MNYKKIITASSVVMLGLGIFTGISLFKNKRVDASTTQETSSYSLMTKVAGSKNYGVYQRVHNGKASGKVANAIDFRYNHLQSNQKISTKKYKYWLLYVDGRRVGWVNENFFAKNKISVAKNVSLVNNEFYTFNTRDAINYATDKTGTVVDNSKVQVSTDSINCKDAGTTNVKYTYGSGKANVKVTVRNDANEGVADASLVKAKQGASSSDSWTTHYGASINYLNPKDFIPEKKTNVWSSGDLTFKTRLYQPIYLSVQTDTNRDGNINRVGHIPEGVTVSNGWAYTSLLSHTNLISGHIVGYNLNKLKSPYNPQYLLTMSQKKFNTYIKNFKVSPYIPVGHGQAMGSTKNYIYVLVNDNSQANQPTSEEIVQINKSDLTINKIWSIKCFNGSSSSPRFFRNAVFTSDNQMYGIVYDREGKRYEFWRFDRNGDAWTPTIVGATEGTFVSNGAPVQGLTYDPTNHNFYLAYNDLIFKLATDGTIQKQYTFKTGREIEGLSVSDNKLYVNLAQRAELLESNPLN